MWLIRRGQDGFTDHHAREALNFQLTAMIAVIASTILAIPVLILGVLTLGVGLVVAALIAVVAVVAWFVLPILAAARASTNEGYRYPFTLRLIR